MLSGKIDADLRSFPPRHAAMMDGRLVEHQIKCIGNSNGTCHFEAGAPDRKIANRTIDRCPVTFERDVSAFENAVALCSSAILHGLFHRPILPSHGGIDFPVDLAGINRFDKIISLLKIGCSLIGVFWEGYYNIKDLHRWYWRRRTEVLRYI
jgi:hypothetical protein